LANDSLEWPRTPHFRAKSEQTLRRGHKESSIPVSGAIEITTAD
jgi:hypothetical protein